MIFVFLIVNVIDLVTNFVYRDLWNLERLRTFKHGNFSYLYDLDFKSKQNVSLMYNFLSEHFANQNSIIFAHCDKEKDKFFKIICYYSYFMYCLSMTDTLTDLNPCNPFSIDICYLYQPIPPNVIPSSTVFPWNFTGNLSTANPIIATTQYFNLTSEVHEISVLKNESFAWNHKFLNEYDLEIPMVLFNLFLCTTNEYKYLCPDLCLGQSQLCMGIDNVHSTNCFSSSSWQKEISKFGDLINNKFDFDSIEYSCDCKYGYTWSFLAKECSFGGLFPNPCDLITLAPCFEMGTVACIGDSYSGEFICRCKPQYLGVLCEHIINACHMEVVSLDGNTEGETQSNSRTSSNFKTGYEMCRVNMSGLAIKSFPNECIPILGSRKYECICHYPFLEDLDYKVSNCLKIETACYNELCINGVCKESKSGDEAICVCNEDYEGQMCEYKISSWSHWSECSPECGLDRTRIRERKSTLAVVYKQIELCPIRIDEDCPVSQFSGFQLPSPFTNDELKFYTFYFFTAAISVGFLAIIMYFSQLLSVPKFVGARRREIEKNKAKRFQEKQKFSLWKIEQLQNQME